MNASGSPLMRADDAGKWLRAQLSPQAQLTADSRAVGQGDGFLAYPGLRTDGRRFIGQACSNGAAAVLYEAADTDDSVVPQTQVPACAMRGLHSCAGEVSSAYYGHPSAAMTVYAVTGTNGKTSCAHWLAAGAAGAVADDDNVDGVRAAALGTLGVTRYNPVDQSASADRPATPASERGLTMQQSTLTTPDAVSLQRSLAKLATEGVSTVALEASSIGMSQHRLADTAVDVAVFTNLTRDHLDYHGDMDAYGQAKQALFNMPRLHAAVVNGDDPAAALMLAACEPQVATYSYGFEPRRYAGSAQCAVRIKRVESEATAMRIEFDGDLGRADATLCIVGHFNALNAAAVCLAWHAAGVPFAQAVARLALLRSIAGRMQVVPVTDQQVAYPLVVVDYAHTPDALQAALQALRPAADARGGRLWVIFGCGGDRDAGKRALMGAVAARDADKVVLTNDNPRSEAPGQIIDEIARGLSASPWLREPDRASAIVATVGAAAPEDVVLIAGKGHEDYQELATGRIPFSDVQVARSALQQRAGAC